MPPGGILNTSQVAIDFHSKIIAKLFLGKGKWGQVRFLVALPLGVGRVREGTQEAPFSLDLPLTCFKQALCVSPLSAQQRQMHSVLGVTGPLQPARKPKSKLGEQRLGSSDLYKRSLASSTHHSPHLSQGMAWRERFLKASDPSVPPCS